MGYNVKPNGPWRNADTATITYEGTDVEDVPILRFKWTSGYLTINSTRYPKGLVVLNEILPANEKDDTPITLEIDTSTGEDIKKEVNSGGEWPNGFVGLFI